MKRYIARRLMQGKDHPVERAPNAVIATTECAMHALKDLFTTDVGLMSAAGIAFMLGMGWLVSVCSSPGHGPRDKRTSGRP